MCVFNMLYKKKCYLFCEHFYSIGISMWYSRYVLSWRISTTLVYENSKFGKTGETA